MRALPDQRMSILTIGVVDVDAARQFYQDVVGFKPFMTEGMTLFDMGGIVLGLWERDKLHQDMGLMGNTCPKGACPNFAIAYNTRSRAEVDEIFERLKNHGVEITVEPHAASWGGYSGYFLDPDGHAWEVVHNPHWALTETGQVQIPQKGGA